MQRRTGLALLAAALVATTALVVSLVGSAAKPLSTAPESTASASRPGALQAAPETTKNGRSLSARQVASLSARIARLERRLQRIDSELAQCQEDRRQRLDDPAQPVESIEEPLPLTPEEVQAEQEARTARLEQLLGEEVGDSEFQGKIEDDIERIVESMALDVRLASIDCGTTFCKVEARDGDAASMDLLAQAAFHLKGLAGASFTFGSTTVLSAAPSMSYTKTESPITRPSIE